MVRWPLLSGPLVHHHHSQYAQDGQQYGPNIKFPNVYGPQDDRTGKTALRSGRPLVTFRSVTWRGFVTL